jgi:hypothetical protein
MQMVWIQSKLQDGKKKSIFVQSWFVALFFGRSSGVRWRQLVTGQPKKSKGTPIFLGTGIKTDRHLSCKHRWVRMSDQTVPVEYAWPYWQQKRNPCLSSKTLLTSDRLDARPCITTGRQKRAFHSLSNPCCPVNLLHTRFELFAVGRVQQTARFGIQGPSSGIRITLSVPFWSCLDQSLLDRWPLEMTDTVWLVSGMPKGNGWEEHAWMETTIAYRFLRWKRRRGGTCFFNGW